MSTSTPGTPYEPNEQNPSREAQHHQPRPTKRRRYFLPEIAATAVLALGVGSAAVAMSGDDGYGPVPGVGPTYYSPDPVPEPKSQREEAWERRPEPVPEPDPGPQVPAPPQELVGRWNGGSGGGVSSDWYLTIRADGTYTLVNDWFGLRDSGVVDTSRHGFRTYNSSGDRGVADAAGVDGCSWYIIENTVGLPFLRFCDGASSWVHAG